MKLYLSTIRGNKGRYMARIETVAGRTIAQAIDPVEKNAVNRAIRQATNWGRDHEWGPLTIVRKREVSP